MGISNGGFQMGNQSGQAAIPIRQFRRQTQNDLALFAASFFLELDPTMMLRKTFRGNANSRHVYLTFKFKMCKIINITAHLCRRQFCLAVGAAGELTTCINRLAENTN